jgi:hypothetical protein
VENAQPRLSFHRVDFVLSEAVGESNWKACPVVEENVMGI